MQASFQSADELEFSFLCYLKTQGQSLNPHQWLKVHDFISREAAMLRQDRQTMCQCEQTIHHYLTAVGI